MAHVLRAAWWGVVLLSLPPGALGFQPPITSVRTSLTTNDWAITVHYEVDDSTAGGTMQASREYEGNPFSYWSITGLTNAGGIVSWVAAGVGTFGTRDLELVCAVYDPAPRSWSEISRHFESSLCCPWTLTGPATADGVVHWQASGSGTASYWRREIGFATYDPFQGRWFLETRDYSGTESSYWEITRRLASSGLVAWQRENAGRFAPPSLEVSTAVFDPVGASWKVEAFYYESHLNNTWSITNLLIASQSARWTAENADGSSSETRGYDSSTQTWQPGATVPTSIFLASTNAGQAPLGVWFTDMSLGATNWSWSFGDGTNVTTRSPYHEYKEAGAYTVRQIVTGPGGGDTNALVIVVEAPPGELRFDPSSLRLSEGTFLMRLDGFSGLHPIVLYGSPDLAAWTPLSTNVPRSSPMELTDPDAGSWSLRHYRAVEVPEASGSL